LQYGFTKFDRVINQLKKARLLLFPLGILYGFIMAIRNKLFDLGMMSCEKTSIKSIGVGNLAMGGTGKSVVVMYLIKIFKDFRIATLSRGYGRKTRGLVIAGSKDNPTTIGDESYQFFNRYPETVVAVSEKRTLGMKALAKIPNPPDFVILDDVMQHRWVRPQMMIMTTSFNRPYFEDFVFPAGNLREFRSGVVRADVLIVTRTPEDFSPVQKEVFLKKTNINIPTFFTNIRYSDYLTQNEKTLDSNFLIGKDFLLVTGIADTHHLVEHLKIKYGFFDHLRFKDHHIYSPIDAERINDRAKGKIIVTTEKDYAKLEKALNNNKLYCLMIDLGFVYKEEQHLFEKMIKGL
jgi:tetraacyldisaccharide 4'-kinase